MAGEFGSSGPLLNPPIGFALTRGCSNGIQEGAPAAETTLLFSLFPERLLELLELLVWLSIKRKRDEKERQGGACSNS